MEWDRRATGRREGRDFEGKQTGTGPHREGWLWELVRMDRSGMTYCIDGRGREILRKDSYLCVFCRGRGEKPRGSKCPVCKGKGVVALTPPAVVCAYCHGRGEERPRTNITCTACRGKGFVTIVEPIEICPHCRGRGAEPTNKLPCIKCRGKGVMTVTINLNPERINLR